ncbi:MAG: serine hydrolase [Chloroflexota bacterium]
MADTRRPLFREDFMPAGFVASTAEDMAKAIEMILANGVVSGRPFLSSASVAVLTTGTGPANVTGARYAMGWNEQDRDGVRTLVHDGSTTDMASFQGIVPAAGTGLVLLADAQSIPFELMGKIDFVGLGALDQMIGRAPRGTLDHFYPAVDAFLVILFGLMIRGLVLQVRKIGRGEQPRRRGPVRRGSVLALWTYLDVFVPFAILTNGPLFLGADWSVLVRTDVGLVLALIAAIRIADGGLRLVGWSVSHRSPAPRGVVEPVVAPTP